MIADTTNMAIGRKDTLKYLRYRYEWTTEDILRERLQSHLIPMPELANGGYGGLSDAGKTDKLRIDFDRIIQKRTDMARKQARLLSRGHRHSASTLFKDE